MKDLSDLKENDPVILRVQPQRGEPKVYEAIISKVGRTYLSIFCPEAGYSGYSSDYKFYRENGKAKSEYYTGARLYRSMQEVEDEIEHSKLSDFCKKAFSGYGKLPYTLEQLREIKRILNTTETN